MSEFIPENTQPVQDISEVRKVRQAKLAELVAAGKDPFEITTYDRTATAGAIRADYDAYADKDVSVAGRLMSKRVMGKASFGHIADSDGELQLYFSRDDMGVEAYREFKKLDVGDIIGVKGKVFRTKTGEITVHVAEYTLLVKSLLPLPEKYHGLKDPELRYRQRYVDLIANPGVKEIFIKRSKIVSAIRAATWRSRATTRWKRPSCILSWAARTRVLSSPITTRSTWICICASPPSFISNAA